MRRWLLSDRGLGAVLVMYAALMAVFAVVLVVMFSRTNDTAREAAGAVESIQRSRFDLCEQQNARHDATLRALDMQIAKLPARERRVARARRAGTVALIDALSPRRDCVRVFPPHL